MVHRPPSTRPAPHTGLWASADVRSIERHFAQSFATQSLHLSDIAAELQARRGGPPGPTDTHTRYMTGDIPYGLVFCAALGQMAGVPMPATQTVVDAACLVAGRDFKGDNAVLAPLGIDGESATGLLARVSFKSGQTSQLT